MTDWQDAETTMKAAMAIFATLLTACGGAWAQQDEASSGPFTRQEAELLSAVWPQIRSASSFEQIDWESVGLDEPPGNSEARRLVEENWGALRQAGRFEDINWEATTGYRGPLGEFEPEDFSEAGPFTEQEAGLMAAVWPEIRGEQNFDDIDWDDVGLNRAPGSREARQVMEDHWDDLRRADRFEDIDWNAMVGDRESGSLRRDSSFDGDGQGPFTREEAEILSEVWPDIRRSRNYQDIDWEDVGVDFAPGDARARRLMAENWDALRQAERFDDIDWQTTTGYQSFRGR